jgi:hypothetical protein
MKRASQSMSYQKWAQLGSDLKKMNRLMSSIRCGELQDHMTKKEFESLRKAQNAIVSFKSVCEGQMFREIAYLYKTDRDLLDVFYGASAEPLPEPERKEGY